MPMESLSAPRPVPPAAPPAPASSPPGVAPVQQATPAVPPSGPRPVPSVSPVAAALPVIALPPPASAPEFLADAEGSAPQPLIELGSESIEEPVEPEASLEDAEIEEEEEEVSAEEEDTSSLPEIDLEAVSASEPSEEAPEEDETTASGVWSLDGTKAPAPPQAEVQAEALASPEEPPVEEKKRAPIDLGELPPESEEPLQLAATWEFVTQGAGAEVHAGHETTASWEERGVDLETPVAAAPEGAGSPQDEVALVPTWSFMPQWQPGTPAAPTPPSPPKPPAPVTALPVLAPELATPEPTTRRYGLTSQAVTTTAKYGTLPTSGPMPGFPEVETDPFEEFAASEAAKPSSEAGAASVPWDDEPEDDKG